MEAENQNKKHVVMLPFMAQGHLIPFLALAKLIAARNPTTTTIHLANTPLNIRSLEPLIPPGSNIHLYPLPFQSSDQRLPPGTENTDSLAYPQILHFYPASESLRPQFCDFLDSLTRRHGRRPNLIIADVFFSWTVEIAREMAVPHAAFTTCSAFGTAAYFALWLHLPHAATLSPDFGLPGFPESFRLRRSQMSSYMRSADGSEPWSAFFRRQISLSMTSDAILCNTAEGLEVEGLRLLRKNTGLPVWPVGPLIGGRAGRNPGIETEACVRWLDSHPPASVVYVSFGSQNSISASQMAALAAGLELSGSPFVWMVRPPVGTDVSEEFNDEWLPEGFEARMRGLNRGILIRRWAPQLDILSHASTGAFLSHCGWNSAMESLSRGVPVIGWPLASEQFYNSKMMEEEMGVAVEVASGAEEEVDGGELGRVIRSVMEGEKGEEMRRRAAGFMAAMRDAVKEGEGSMFRAVDEFIETFLNDSN